ncbi:MAG: hypothetical protein KDD92_07515 [Caldilineaceae bacterium]|nr:hypothetical protein [Caldilineaceae bacterium]
MMLISGCRWPFGLSDSLAIHQSSQENVQVPDSPLYVVATGPESVSGLTNELLLLNSETGKTLNRTRLLKNGVIIWQMSSDPDGRIWIGYYGTPGNSSNSVDVFSPEGYHLQTLYTCANPGYGIHFADGYAFVACGGNGFKGGVSIVDLESLEVIEFIELSAEPSFLLLASAQNDDSLAFFGSSQTHSTLFLLYTEPFKITKAEEIYGSASPREVIGDGNEFFLLNTASSLHPDDPKDVRILSPTESVLVADVSLPARSPLWGAINDQKLYSFHSSQGAIVGDSPERAISSYDLITSEMDLWLLPDNWDASDMAVINDQIVLVGQPSVTAESDPIHGLYAFDPESGELSLLYEIPGARLVLQPAGE